MIRNFDEEAYLDANPDVRKAIENGEFPSVEIYLEQFGLERIRSGSTLFHKEYEAFDEVAYLTKFPEVAEAVASKVFSSGFKHFSLFGYMEIITGSREWPKNQEMSEEAAAGDSATFEDAGTYDETQEDVLWDEDMALLLAKEAAEEEHLAMNPGTESGIGEYLKTPDTGNAYAFIPFTVSPLPEGPVLVFAPHPDDETFGMGGSILQMVQNGSRVDVVMMTDGAAGGDEEVRKGELEKAMKILGVSDIRFFGAPDQGLSQNSSTLYSIVRLVREYRPMNVFFPSPMEYHPDHRTTAWLVWNALQSIGYRGNVYAYEIANQSPVNMLVDITPFMPQKNEAMRCYVSQLAQVDYIGTVTSMDQLRAYTLPGTVKYAEAFYRFPDMQSDLMSYYYTHLHKYHAALGAQKLPLVSVLIRTKNRPELLGKALLSVQMQYYQNLEVNIVNDGGSEIEHIVERFDFERCYIRNNKESKGRAGAANDLLKMVNGDYAIFLDDDDTFDSSHIDDLLGIMLKNEGLLAAYSAVRIGEDLKNEKYYNHPYSAALLRRGNYIPFHAVLFSRKLIDMGCRFDESLEIYEDWDFWLQVSQHSDFYYLDKVSATYHISGTSGTGGAGGHTMHGADLGRFKRKIYEKWACVWTPEQLEETFNALAAC